MLSGEATLVWGDEEHPLRRDHYACFPAGDPRAHHLENRSAAPCSYLLIGERKPDDVVVYPEHQKALIKSLDRKLIDL